MVLDKLGQSLRSVIDKISGATFVDEKLINELVKDIQRALLQADVDVQIVFALAKQIKKRIQEEKTPQGLNRKDHLTHILYEELANILGGEFEEIQIKRPKKDKAFHIMLVGLFGNGKTTQCGKLAKYYAKRGYKVALISTDTWRPAAYEQLKQTGAQINVPVFGDPTQKDPIKIYDSFKKELQQFDIVFVDTAGRDALNNELIDEITKLHKHVDPEETLLTLTADIGKTAKAQAQTFHDTCGITGIIITKLDGTAKGGGALTACAITSAPVKFIGVGEKIDDLEEFKPKNFVGQLLGMGDLEKLMTKVEDAFDQEDAQDLQKRLLKGEFTLVDLYEQMQAMKKMGPLNKVLDLVPGLNSAQLPKEALQVQEEKITIWKYVMDSCTKYELENPLEISSQRIERIAKGSGRKEPEVRELLKHYKQSKKLVKVFKGMGGTEVSNDKTMSEKQMQKMMRKMGNMKSVMKNMMKGGMR